MSQHITLGIHGEDHAAAYLERQGFRIRDRNWRCHAGEIDIVATDGPELVVVEVKTRSSIGYGHPFEALTPSKVARLYRLGALWRSSHEWRGGFRIDAIAVFAPADQPVHCEHLRGVQ